MYGKYPHPPVTNREPQKLKRGMGRTRFVCVVEAGFVSLQDLARHDEYRWPVKVKPLAKQVQQFICALFAFLRPFVAAGRANMNSKVKNN